MFMLEYSRDQTAALCETVSQLVFKWLRKAEQKNRHFRIIISRDVIMHITYFTQERTFHF